MKDMTWSHSRIELFYRCPYAWQCKYIDKLPEARSDVFHLGRRFHEAAAEYARHCHKVDRETDWDIGRAIAKRFVDEPQIEQMILRFVEGFAFDIKHMIGVEERLLAQLPSGDMFQGVLDYLAIDGSTAHITDWKTQASFPRYDEEKVPVQLLRYAWLVQAVYPQVEQFRLANCYVRFGREHEWWLTGKMDSSEIVQAVQYIKREAEGAGVAGLEPTPSGWCTLCGYTAICPVAKMQVPEGDAHAAAQKLLVLDAERSRLQGMVRQWCNENGGLRVGDKEFGYFATERPRVRNMEAFLKWCNDNGLDWLEIVQTPARTLSKLLREHEDLEELLEVETKATFRCRKAKEEV